MVVEEDAGADAVYYNLILSQNNLLPLRGFLECNCCGSNLTGSGSKSKTGKKNIMRKL